VLPTGALLCRRLSWGFVSCPWCSTTNEDIPHIFWFCSFAQRFWQELFASTGLVPSIWLLHSSVPSATGTHGELLAWSFWLLWKARCLKSFKKVSPSISTLVFDDVHQSRSFIHLLHSARAPQHPSRCPDLIHAWVDGSFTNSSELAGGGWVIALRSGKILAAGMFVARVTSVLHIELLATLAALRELKTRGFTQAFVHTDSTQVLGAIHEGKYLHSAIELAVGDCRDILRTLAGLQLQYLSRRATSTADWLAKTARVTATDAFWGCGFPTSLSSFLSTDLEFLNLM